MTSDDPRDLELAEEDGPAPATRRLDVLLEWAAIAMVPLGLTVIVLGWFGAAHTPYLFEQVPYLISGGLLGVGLLAAAGAMYLASWISRASQAQRTDNARVLAALEELRIAVAVSGATGVATGGDGARGAHLATPNGSMFHRPDCAVVEGRDDLVEVDVGATDLRPCGMCDPLGAGQRTASTN